MRLEYYKDGSKERRWRWRLRSNNGAIVGASSEGFNRKTDMLVNIELTFSGLHETSAQWKSDLRGD